MAFTNRLTFIDKQMSETFKKIFPVVSRLIYRALWENKVVNKQRLLYKQNVC